jgi:hypothetical protein
MSSTGSPARLSELIAALSLATDLGLGEPMEHLLRSCLISMRLGERMGLTDAERAEVYYVSLLAWWGVCPTPPRCRPCSAMTSRGVPTLVVWVMRHWPCPGFFFGVRD